MKYKNIPTEVDGIRNRLQYFREVVLGYDGSDCLDWPFAKISTGYGQVSIAGKHHLVHRLVCQEIYGEPPPGRYEAAHYCGRRICCNWRHLRWATASENQMDRVEHGTHMRGARQWMSKLKDNDVLEIRAAKGAVSQSALAKQFGVARSTISDIHRDRIWAWL